ncbi:MAG: transcriptional repressor [Deltaproteobacteria bacterium]|nr:transcriptional repressor [Deltaproteobacteria bacterium]
MELSNEQIVEKMRSCGLKPTSQRIAILKNIMSRKDHPGAEALYQDLKDDHPALSMNTIYMNLESFAQKGLIQRANFLHKFARYDGDTTPHPHFVCVSCGKIIDLHKLKVPKLKVPEGMNVSKVFDQQIQLNGVCGDCNK